MPKLAKLKEAFPPVADPQPIYDEDWFLIHHVPTDTDATRDRAMREAAALLRRGEPYVTLHCAPLKLPSGIRGERWFVLTPEIHRLFPGSEHRYYVDRITSQGESHDETQGRGAQKHRATGRKGSRKAGRKAGKQAGRKTRQ